MDEAMADEAAGGSAAREPLAAEPVGWYLSVYPSAREASGVFCGTARRNAGRSGVPGEAQDQERSRQMAASRARVVIRRFCSSNVLNRLGTLTYSGSGCHDPLQVRNDVARFFVDLRKSLGGKPLPYLWVPEWHKSGHGLHVHFAVGQFVQRSLIEAAWGHGFVHIILLGNLPVGSTSLDEARKAAGYLSKYVGKSFDDDRVPGLHRYEVAQGFQPQRLQVFGAKLGGALDKASEILGSQPITVSTSDEWKDWTGPQAVSARWAS